jgi:prolyl oligopeptidase
MMDRVADDQYLWLEDITGEDALGWVRKHNEPTLTEHGGDSFEQMRVEALEVLDTDARIPYVRRRGDHLYNFWRDAANPRGLWRRTTLESYRTESPDWDVVLDIDELARIDDENWVWAGADVIEPDHALALVSLSRGGSDAAIVREFDMRTREFVVGGFELPEAKTQISWEDENTVLLGTDFGEGSLTESGYPRLVKRWRRGQPLDDAETLFTAASTDVIVAASVDRTPGFERTMVRRAIDFYNDEVYELRRDGLIRIDAPTDATVSVHRDWLLIELRTDWYAGTAEYIAGSLLAARYDEFLAGTAQLHVVFEPDEHTSLNHYAWTRDKLVVVTLVDVASRVEVFTPASWQASPIPGVPDNTNTVIATADHPVTKSSWIQAVSTPRLDCCTGRQLAIWPRSSGRRRSSTRAISSSHSTSRRLMTGPRSRTSWWATGMSRHRARHCWAAMAVSRWPELRATTGCWAGCGSRVAAHMYSPTSGAGASTARHGTPRRCERADTWLPRTSPRWQGIW